MHSVFIRRELQTTSVPLEKAIPVDSNFERLKYTGNERTNGDNMALIFVNKFSLIKLVFYYIFGCNKSIQ